MHFDTTVTVGNLITVITIILGGLGWMMRLSYDMQDLKRTIAKSLKSQEEFNEKMIHDQDRTHRRMSSIEKFLKTKTVTIDDEFLNSHGIEHTSEKPKRPRKGKK